jgi:AcrR family transcriptional regulator
MNSASPETSSDPPKQRRSRMSAERVLNSSLELLEERGFDAFTVVDVSKRAGMSVGAIYARFGNKEAMLRAVHAHGIERMVEQHAAAASPDRVADDLHTSVVDAVGMVASVFHGNEALLRAFMRLGAVDEVVSHRGSAGSKDLARRFKEKVLAHRDQLVHRDPEVAVDVAYRMAYCIFARRVMDGPAYESDLVISWDELVDEVAAACSAYLLEDRMGVTPA